MIRRFAIQVARDFDDDHLAVVGQALRQARRCDCEGARDRARSDRRLNVERKNSFYINSLGTVNMTCTAGRARAPAITSAQALQGPQQQTFNFMPKYEI
jgi:hypothetical protein